MGKENMSKIVTMIFCCCRQVANEERWDSWSTITVASIAALSVLCVFLLAHVARNRFAARRLAPSNNAPAFGATSYPHQYYKCVAAYEPQVRRSEKLAPL